MFYSIFRQSPFIFISMLFENLPFICMYSFLVCSVKPGSMSRNRGFTAQLFPGLRGQMWVSDGDLISKAKSQTSLRQ